MLVPPPAGGGTRYAEALGEEPAHRGGTVSPSDRRLGLGVWRRGYAWRMKREHDDETPGGFPEPPADDEPGDRSRDPTPHSSLNNPVDEPDPTEWPDPYEKREDPRGAERPVPGSTSTSAPHPAQDPEAEPAEAPERDKLDD
jgi:hypothetical protein